jgi:hypothetical protein
MGHPAFNPSLRVVEKVVDERGVILQNLERVFNASSTMREKDQATFLNPPRGEPRGIFTVRMKIDFQFAR